MRDLIFDEGRPDSDKEPYFANDTPTEYVGLVGGSITFHCHVKDAGNKTVSTYYIIMLYPFSFLNKEYVSNIFLEKFLP